MKLKLIGMKEFRQNMAKYAREVKKVDTRLIVLRKNEPIFEIRPVDKKEIALEKLEIELIEAEKQIKRGEVVSHEEIMKEFGLN